MEKITYSVFFGITGIQYGIFNRKFKYNSPTRVYSFPLEADTSTEIWSKTSVDTTVIPRETWYHRIFLTFPCTKTGTGISNKKLPLAVLKIRNKISVIFRYNRFLFNNATTKKISTYFSSYRYFRYNRY